MSSWSSFDVFSDGVFSGLSFPAETVEIQDAEEITLGGHGIVLGSQSDSQHSSLVPGTLVVNSVNNFNADRMSDYREDQNTWDALTTFLAPTDNLDSLPETISPHLLQLPSHPMATVTPEIAAGYGHGFLSEALGQPRTGYRGLVGQQKLPSFGTISNELPAPTNSEQIDSASSYHDYLQDLSGLSILQTGMSGCSMQQHYSFNSQGTHHSPKLFMEASFRSLPVGDLYSLKYKKRSSAPDNNPQPMLLGRAKVRATNRIKELVLDPVPPDATSLSVQETFMEIVKCAERWRGSESSQDKRTRRLLNSHRGSLLRACAYFLLLPGELPTGTKKPVWAPCEADSDDARCWVVRMIKLQDRAKRVYGEARFPKIFKKASNQHGSYSE